MSPQQPGWYIFRSNSEKLSHIYSLLILIIFAQQAPDGNICDPDMTAGSNSMWCFVLCFFVFPRGCCWTVGPPGKTHISPDGLLEYWSWIERLPATFEPDLIKNAWLDKAQPLCKLICTQVCDRMRSQPCIYEWVNNLQYKIGAAAAAGPDHFNKFKAFAQNWSYSSEHWRL